MSTVDEMLAEQLELEENPICHIEKLTRKIILHDDCKFFGVENDKKVERIKFDCDRFVGDEDLDLTLCQALIVYENANGEPGFYNIKDMESKDNMVYFSWLLDEDVTRHKGEVKFIFYAYMFDQYGEESAWNTIPAYGNVEEGLTLIKDVEEKNVPAIEEILVRIASLEKSGMSVSAFIIFVNEELKTSTKSNAEIYEVYLTGRPTYLVLHGDGIDYILKPFAAFENAATFCETYGNSSVVVSIIDDEVFILKYNFVTSINNMYANDDNEGHLFFNVSDFPNDAGYQTAAQVESIVEQAIGDMDIPAGGGGAEWKMIANVTLEEEVQNVTLTRDADGNPFALTEEIMLCAKLLPNTAASTSAYTVLRTFSGANDIYGTGLTRADMGKGVPATGQYYIYRYYKFNSAKNEFEPITIMEATGTSLDYVRIHGTGLFEEPSNAKRIPVDKLEFQAYAKMGVGSTIQIYGR